MSEKNEKQKPGENCPKHTRQMWEWNGREWFCILCVVEVEDIEKIPT
jgi:hypothetical protein